VRIISGSARGTKLTTFDGAEIRPTSDRVRGAIFSILTSRLGHFSQKRILDVFAGSGAMGLEALSRGGANAIFVDQAKQAKQLIQTNRSRCRLDKNTRIIHQSAQQALPSLNGQQFDLIFMDPPYGNELIPAIIELVAKYNLLAPDGIICAEEQRNTVIPQHIKCYEQQDVRHYGATSIYLYSHTESSSTGE